MAIQLQPDEREPQRFNDAIRQLTQGRLNAQNEFTLEPGVAFTFVEWINCSVGSKIVWSPQTANAAAAMATTYLPDVDVVQGGFTMRHASNAQVDRTFSFICTGGE